MGDAVLINELIRINSGPNILRSCCLLHWQQGRRKTTACTRLTQDSRKVRNSFHDKEVSAPLHKCACTGACAFSAESMHAFRIKNREETDKTLISSSVKNNPPRQATSALIDKLSPTLNEQNAHT